MRKYELIYILRPDLDQEGVQSLVEKFQTVIANGGEVEKVDVWGKRRLAYEIEKHREGYYVLINFSAPAETVSELDRVLKITDEVIRYMIVRDVA
ncbi:30S ribosomal protein S6 [Paenibacillus thermoaerophilus]|jgi:small subunit ribosomal protein S6|uniref:Small ribosomal subunit protein bS6 n=1 Tax=Paenibacillus thermoaerophilus TaxID=1215385 RepID=A0ABW2V8J8_9BACL|nr:30S ribosomal protein S6 [Paenibacillus thermoaerophilus]TMV06627.1 30S ribosomal protein S6 [Paenibacillus thermoaerophilus]